MMTRSRPVSTLEGALEIGAVFEQLEARRRRRRRCRRASATFCRFRPRLRCRARADCRPARAPALRESLLRRRCRCCGELGDGRAAAQLDRELVAGAVDGEIEFLQAARHLDRPAFVAKVALDLADDRRRRVGRELDAALEVEAIDRLEQADRSDLHEIVERLAAVGELHGEKAHEVQVQRRRVRRAAARIRVGRSGRSSLRSRVANEARKKRARPLAIRTRFVPFVHSVGPTGRTSLPSANRFPCRDGRRNSPRPSAYESRKTPSPAIARFVEIHSLAIGGVRRRGGRYRARARAARRPAPRT